MRLYPVELLHCQILFSSRSSVFTSEAGEWCRFRMLWEGEKINPKRKPLNQQLESWTVNDTVVPLSWN